MYAMATFEYQTNISLSKMTREKKETKKRNNIKQREPTPSQTPTKI